MSNIENLKKEILQFHNDPEYLLEDALDELIYEAKDNKYPHAYRCKSCQKRSKIGMIEERLMCTKCGRTVHPDDLDINELDNYKDL